MPLKFFVLNIRKYSGVISHNRRYIRSQQAVTTDILYNIRRFVNLILIALLQGAVTLIGATFTRKTFANFCSSEIFQNRNSQKFISCNFSEISIWESLFSCIFLKIFAKDEFSYPPVYAVTFAVIFISTKQAHSECLTLTNQMNKS